MIIPFIWGVVIGVFSGVAAAFYWAYRKGKKINNQEVNEVPELAAVEKTDLNHLDITPEMVVTAYNTIRQYCKQQIGCKFGCPFKEGTCGESFYESPEAWPELEVPDVYKQ